jgi:hypothetical protein
VGRKKDPSRPWRPPGTEDPTLLSSS